MNEPSAEQSSHAGYQRPSAIQFALESIKYGASSFYRVGIVWWLLTAIYALVDYLAGPPAYEPGFKFPVMLLAMFFAFVLLLIKYPYLVIGLNYHRKGGGDVNDASMSLKTFKSYAGVCLIFAVAMIPAFVFLSMNLKDTDILYFILFGLAILLVFLVLVRLFPLLYAVIDKKLDPLSALKLSWEMTSSMFLPVLTLLIGLAVIEGVFSVIPYGIGSLISMPVNYLASIHAYKLLDLNYEMKRVGTVNV
jgi:hypothetical protein